MEVYLAISLIFSASFVGLGAAAPVDIQAKYPFSSVLFDDQGQYYGLHWNFTRSTETIYFAVNVSTTGWIGFGLSPNGQMPGSDVVMGWVSNTGENFFHDRFAEGRFLPPVDSLSQDWFLTNSEEQDGFTILEFSRSFVSCDPQDLDITAATDRVVWSFSMSDPSDPLGSDATQHSYQGSQSFNLLGGLPSGNRAVSEDESYLDITVSNVTIPQDSTTYWCASFQLPEELRNTTGFINRIVPEITPHATSFVHHALVYLCTEALNEDEIGASTFCRSAELTSNVDNCRGGPLIGAWAVNGETFVYPEGVAFPLGGVGKNHFVVLEMHYDNPQMVQGVVDNSGLRFYYTFEEPENRAGIIFAGHEVVEFMIVPPQAPSYSIAGICSSTCTSALVPEGGIHIFANALHTHLIGRSLILEHYRRNSNGQLEELEPIDLNPSYDFDYQQVAHLPRIHTVLPGDTLVLRCNYSSMGRDTITTGGLSTEKEMCLSFPIFYPAPADGSAIFKCVSQPGQSTINNIIGDPRILAALSGGGEVEDLNNIEWDSELQDFFQNAVLDSAVTSYCLTENGEGAQDDVARLPVVDQRYQAPDRCASGALPLTFNMGVTTLLPLLMAFIQS